MREGMDDILAQMAERDRTFGQLYREAAKAFGLSEVAMWVLYAVACANGHVSQRELSDSMALSKQTVHSAVVSLSSKGLVALRVVAGTRNRKDIVLTQEGRSFADRTVLRMREAEGHALEALGEERARLYVVLHDELIAALATEFEKAGFLYE